MKKQVVVIHGGDPHNSYKEYLADLKRTKLERRYLSLRPERGWKDAMNDELGNSYELLAPEMPNWANPKYLEWEIWFEKTLSFVNDGAVFIGHSLGAIFLAQYLATHGDTSHCRAVFLLAAPYRDAKSKDKLADFALPRDVSRLRELGDRLHLYHSTDDPTVPFSALSKYKKLLPEAQTRVFSDRGHFRVKKLPEIVDDIRKAFAKKK